MECHRCPYNGKGSNHCLSCKETLTSRNHGKTHISFEHIPEKELIFVQPKKTRGTKFTNFMRVWLRLDTQTRDLLADIISTNHTQIAIANNAHISPSLLNWRLKQLATKFPELKSVLKMRLKSLRP